MWYKKFLKNEQDGLVSLLSLFKNEESFYVHLINNILFFNPEDVRRQAIELKEQIDNKGPIPVRFTMKTKKYFQYKNENISRFWSTKSFRNKKEAKIFAKKNEYFYAETGTRICIDNDGNNAVRDEILKFSGYKVSAGETSDFNNYVISHIWANTYNPYFFTSLWNIALVPSYLAFILDKPDKNSEITRKSKLIVKAICYRLYSPNTLYQLGEIVDENELKVGLEFVDKLRKNNIIKFIGKKAQPNFEKTVAIL